MTPSRNFWADKVCLVESSERHILGKEVSHSMRYGIDLNTISQYALLSKSQYLYTPTAHALISLQTLVLSLDSRERAADLF